jgi:hypothetical protein
LGALELGAGAGVTTLVAAGGTVTPLSREQANRKPAAVTVRKRINGTLLPDQEKFSALAYQRHWPNVEFSCCAIRPDLGFEFNSPFQTLTL